MKITVFKTIIFLLFFAGSLSSCSEWEPAPAPKSARDFNSVPNYMYGDGILPWVYDVIEERLENGVHGTITQCNYRDGYGYLFEPLGNSTDLGYCFLTFDSTVLYEVRKTR